MKANWLNTSGGGSHSKLMSDTKLSSDGKYLKILVASGVTKTLKKVTSINLRQMMTHNWISSHNT